MSCLDAYVYTMCVPVAGGVPKRVFEPLERLLAVKSTCS